MWDAIVVGGGPSGLSAALVLGRCRRRVLVGDSREYRNAASHALHAFLSRDGVPPAELLGAARAEVERYGVVVRRVRVADARRDADGFEVVLDGGARETSRMLVLATGVVDPLPPVPGIDALYGTSVFHCPYCDGWEQRDRPLAAYGRGEAGRKIALSLRQWSDDVILFSNGPAGLRADDRARLARAQVRIEERGIARLDGAAGELRAVVLTDGESVARRALFFKTRYAQRSELAAKLGCVFDRKGVVKTNRLQGTGVEGLYVIGDAARDVQLAIVAAAEGAKAGFAVNEALHDRETA
jgi:thioredoxin reductase